jgi:predicted GH43/DUF377 family glycosyl hydrolase
LDVPLFRRTLDPILTPSPDVAWASGAIFNPGAVLDDAGTLRLLVRGVPAGHRRVTTAGDSPYEPDFGYEGYVSSLGLATRRPDGAFVLADEPLLAAVPGGCDAFGCEDARITRLGDRYYITYTALSEPAATATDGVGIALATTTDWATVERHGRIGPAVRDKDAAIFPDRVGGRVAMLHRIAPDIQLVLFDDEDQLLAPGDAFWAEHLDHLDEWVVMRPEQPWEGKKIGAGPPPLWTPEGWLLIYHGADRHHVYRAGLALLDLDDPRRVIARTKHPILEPELPFEREGDVPNVVFPEGAVVEGEALHVFYGAADSAVGHASAPMADVLALLHEEKKRWRIPPVHVDFRGHRDRPKTLGEAGALPFERLHGGRPVLEPVPEHDWESRVVLNPAAVLVDDPAELEALMAAWGLTADERDTLRRAGGACAMLYRAQGTGYARDTPHGAHYASALGLAVLTPELELVCRWPAPVLAPEAPFHDLGVEDARCTKVGDTYYLHYTGYASSLSADTSFAGRVRLCLATTRDFLDWTLHGPLEGDVNRHDDKNGALFPEPVDGPWLLWHRPMYGRHPMAMHLAEADRPEGPWRSRGRVLASYRFREQALSWVGAAGPPLALGDGRFLALYHQGHLSFEGKRLYNLSAMLVEPAAEQPVRARIEPVLLPEGDLERVGDPLLGVDNVVFSCANYVVGEHLVVPYAGADSRIFGARLPLAALVARLEAAAEEEAAVRS